MKDKIVFPGDPAFFGERQNSEAMDLVLICAQDIVDAWPQTTIRTLGQMTKRMDTLRQALEALKK